MNDRLVCAVDGTPRSAGAVCAAVAIGRALGLRVVLVHVAEPGNGPTDVVRSAAATLERSLAGLPIPPDAVRRIEVGPPAELVVAAADDEGAALILTGTRQASGRASAVFGTVAARIVELARTPVVVAPPASCAPALGGRPPAAREVLIAVDGSDESRAVAALAGDLARRARASIVLAHVVPPLAPAAAPPTGIVPPIAGSDAESGRRVLDDARRMVPEPGTVELELRHGIPARELERLARERESDLIVLGTRRPGRLRRILAGSLADDLLASSDRLLMLVPDDVARSELERRTVSSVPA